MLRLCLLIFITLNLLPGHASFAPITDEMIRSGICAYNREGVDEKDYLEPLRLGQDLEVMERCRQSTLHLTVATSSRGHTTQILALNVTKGLTGTILFFKWIPGKSINENFRMIDQHMFKTGEFRHYSGGNRLGSLSYSFKRADGEKRMCYKEGVGYFASPANARPFIYCNLGYYTVNYDHQNMGIGRAFVAELAHFVFKSTSADFITALVADDNYSSRKVLYNSKFLSVRSILDRDAPGYRREDCVGRSNVYITFDNSATFVQAGLSIGERADFYLPRPGMSFAHIKSSL